MAQPPLLQVGSQRPAEPGPERPPRPRTPASFPYEAPRSRPVSPCPTHNLRQGNRHLPPECLAALLAHDTTGDPLPAGRYAAQPPPHTAVASLPSPTAPSEASPSLAVQPNRPPNQPLATAAEPMDVSGERVALPACPLADSSQKPPPEDLPTLREICAGQWPTMDFVPAEVQRDW